MPSKKKTYLQQFGIIHLPNPDLTYFRNPERETKLYLCHSTSWKLKSGIILCYLFLFSPSHLTRNHDANRTPRAYIYALEAGFSQIAKNCQVLYQTVRGIFLMFLPKIKNDNLIGQTTGDALTIYRPVRGSRLRRVPIRPRLPARDSASSSILGNIKMQFRLSLRFLMQEVQRGKILDLSLLVLWKV